MCVFSREKGEEKLDWRESERELNLWDGKCDGEKSVGRGLEGRERERERERVREREGGVERERE